MSFKVEEVAKINAGCKNGFYLTVDCYGEKDLTKVVKLNDQKHIKANLYWRDYKHTGMKEIVLHLAEYTNNISHGLGKFISVSEPVSRRSMKALQQLTFKMDDDYIMSMFNNTKDETCGGIIF